LLFVLRLEKQAADTYRSDIENKRTGHTRCRSLTTIDNRSLSMISNRYNNTGRHILTTAGCFRT
ncbi:MAG: hypothetical protein PVH78_02815, partial [Deltaproteobacteria bacterium]